MRTINTTEICMYEIVYINGALKQRFKGHDVELAALCFHMLHPLLKLGRFEIGVLYNNRIKR